MLTLNAPITTKVVCFSRLLKNVLEASVANRVDPDQTAPIGAVFSGSTLFASILNSSVMLGNFSQQTTSADDIFRCIFWRFKGYLTMKSNVFSISRGTRQANTIFCRRFTVDVFIKGLLHQ